jgi:acyl-CoA thioesterase I
MEIKFIYAIFVLVFFSSCHAQNQKTVDTTKSTGLRYVALGDSYTICEGAKAEEAWPQILSEKMSANGKPIQLIANPSRTGWTSQHLIDRELPIFDTCRADIVTLLIGVNDWVQGVSEANFRINLVYILEHLQSKLADKSKILLITIPDFGVTPTGKLYSAGRDISKGIESFNLIIKEEASKRNLPVVDIFPLSKAMGSDKSLVAKDGLHPSAKEYAEWEKIIRPAFEKMIPE